jgi:FtsP/CotA-like multicopper oxidase with cupredoxin domain
MGRREVMKDGISRRNFIAAGVAAAAGTLAARVGHAAQSANPTAKNRAAANQNAASTRKSHSAARFSEFSRYHPSFGGPVGSDHYLGKLVPGLRKSGLKPVPFEAPNLGKIPWKMVNGAKEFHIHCTPVKREFLPDRWMNVWGYNGSMPGPTIEAYQGDRVRFVVHNDLPEPTTIHWHGLEDPVQFDGVPGVTQDFIQPGRHYVYEFDLHQTGSFFYHSHVAMQEAFGMVGFFIIHPQVAYDPPVDRDFGLVFQSFAIPPNSSIPDSMAMDWPWNTINGRSGPYATPLVCKHGERVRVRLLDFSPMQHHPIHLHGHTYWLTGTEAGRIPASAWIPRNTTLVGVAMVQEFEFIAFNPGDWTFHCHMVHHMMNHMVHQVGPRIREGVDVSDYLAALPNRPPVQSSAFEDGRLKVPSPPQLLQGPEIVHKAPGFRVPGYPEKMQGMEMTPDQMKKIWSPREVQGMRHNWFMGLAGLMTAMRVLPEELYHRVMETDEPIQHGEIFNAIVNGNYRTPKGSAGG